MISAGPDTFASMLGETQARLHNINADPIIDAFQKQDFDETWYRLQRKFDGAGEGKKVYPWLTEIIDWLLENRPPEPDNLSLCHNDFHPLNILVRDGKVSGVIDWGRFLVGDPAMDIACTLFINTIAAKIVMPDLDTDKIKEEYLNGYRNKRDLDEKNLDYYFAFRCVEALTEGLEGNVLLQHPEIVKQALAAIFATTGINIKIPRFRLWLKKIFSGT